MQVRPLGDRVIIERVEAKENYGNSSIVIPDMAKEKPQEGVIVAVGDGKVFENGTVVPLKVCVGDRIMFGKYSGADITVEGQTYLILREEEIIAVYT